MKLNGNYKLYQTNVLFISMQFLVNKSIYDYVYVHNKILKKIKLRIKKIILSLHFSLVLIEEISYLG